MIRRFNFVAAPALAFVIQTLVAPNGSLFAQQRLGTLNSPASAAYITYTGVSHNISGITSVGNFDADPSHTDDLVFIDRSLQSGTTLIPRLYLVYGSSTTPTSPIVLGNVPGAGGSDTIDGFAIKNIANKSLAETIVTKVGDINGDGTDDFGIGNEIHDTSAAPRGGQAAFLFGRAPSGTKRTTAVDLSAIGTTSGLGVTFVGPYEDWYTGSSISAAGDVNGDHINDFLIGADAAEHPNWHGQPGTLNNTGVHANDDGAAYLIYGSSTLGGSHVVSDVNISGHPKGITILSEGAQGDSLGSSTAIGDVNLDGFADILVQTRGASFASEGSSRGLLIYGREGSADPSSPSAAFPAIIHAETIGKSSSTMVQEYLSQDDNDPQSFPGTPGAVFINTNTSTLKSSQAANLGDINGDAIDDFVTETHVVFGKTGNTLMSKQVNTTYTALTGQPTRSNEPQIAVTRIGNSASGADRVDGFKADHATGIGKAVITPIGDFNGDGLNDFLIRNRLVYGKLDNLLMTLADNASDDELASALDNTNSLVINVSSTGVVFAAGDVNGDGLSDIIVNEPSAGSSGESYLIRGKANLPGDINGDLTVGSGDLNVILSRWHMHVKPGAYGLGDVALADGYIDDSDLDFVLTNWGASASLSAGGVPEPTTLSLLCIGVVGAFSRRRSR